MTTPPKTILRIDASMRREGSVSRDLTGRLVARLAGPATRVIARDLAEGVPHVTETWIGASFTDPAERTPAQRAELATSDTYIEELRAADTVVIGVPIYNFGVPAALKAWVDLVARARVTFRYTESGPEGLLTGKRAILAVASGGVAVGSEADFATSYMRQALAFLGITEVEIVKAEKLVADADAALAAATSQIERVAA